MWPDGMLFQSLRRIELIDPWRMSDGSVGKVGRSLLAGAIVLHFEQAAAVFMSPLRYSRCQRGTTVDVLGAGALSDLGYRFTLLDAEDATRWVLPNSLSRLTVDAESWLLPSWSDQPPPPLLLSTALTAAKDGVSVSLRLLRGGWHQLTHRLDLDGCIEFSPAGHHFHPAEPVTVSSPQAEFGWLHPASPYPFALDDRCWRSAHPRDWPWSLRRVWGSQPTDALYRSTMRRALLARFAQHDRLHARLLALRRSFSVEGVPNGLIEEITTHFQTLHGQRAGGVAQ
jgi:hypothetical protein